MQRKNLTLLVVFLLAILAAAVLWTRRKPAIQFGCVEQTKIIEVTDTRYMRDILESGKSYEALMGYYHCNPLQRNDIVLYRFSNTADPVIKIVRAVEGDRFELVQNKNIKAWNLRINGELIMYKDQPYFFGAATKPTLGLYEKSRANVLGKDELIVLSQVPPGFDDSGIFGVINKNDIVAKIKIP